jgi:hypothetical protein
MPRIGRYVLPTIELLLKHLKAFVDTYSPVVNMSDDDTPDTLEHWGPAKDRYLRNSLELGWVKLDKYYQLTDNSSAYVAAIASIRALNGGGSRADRVDWQKQYKKLHKTKSPTLRT